MRSIGRTKSHNRAGLLRRELSPCLRIKTIALCVASALAVYPGLHARAQDLPANPQVVGGAASISQSGNQQTITQSTDRAIVNWGSFSIGADHGVNFIQPSASSVILNRVIGNDPSSILGTLTANGRVFLVNPNGVFFGAGSSVDAGGLVATTMSIADDDFMSGYFDFKRSGAGQVENAGLITIRDGGFALLAADQVGNTASGRIEAPNGAVMLASAERVTIDTHQDGLVGFSVSGDAIREAASVDNAGLIAADGGQVMLSARGAQELTGMVVNNSGTIRARTVEERDGTIILSGSSGVTQSSGVLDASGSRGGSVRVDNSGGTAGISGTVNVTGSAGQGGDVVVTGDQTGLFAGADIDASGTLGGGTALIGGGYQGNNAAVQNARRTYVDQDATVRADAREQGDGGEVVVWADDITRFNGQISARGGAIFGNGGLVETSGRNSLLIATGSVDTSATNGAFGNWLLDPMDINVVDPGGSAGLGDVDQFGDAGSGSINVSLINNASSTVTLQAKNDVTFDTSVDMTKDMIVQAGNDITWGSNTIKSLGDLTFTANDAGGPASGSGGISGSGLLTSGGNVTLNSGSDISVDAIDAAGNVSMKSTQGKIVAGGPVTATSAGNVTIDITAASDITINGALNATSTAGRGAVNIVSSDNSIFTSNKVTINNSITASGAVSSANGESAFINIFAKGNIEQTGGVIKADDTAATAAGADKEAHFARANINSGEGAVKLKNVEARSATGRAQVDVNARGNITVANGGSITSTAAAQPGINLSSTNGNVTTTGATLAARQTGGVEETKDGKTSVSNPNKVSENAGGVSVEGGTLNLGRIESVRTAGNKVALFGIATASRGNTTFNDNVTTNSDAGISASTSGSDAKVQTVGSAFLKANALALTGDRDKGIFSVRTDIGSLTVLGGRGVDIDNTAHGAGTLTISALGRISGATTDPNTDTEIPATDKPVGGVRIQSQNINLLSMDNRSTNSYQFDGTRTNTFFNEPQQDLRLIADNIEFVPGTIQTKSASYVQLRPLSNTRNIQVAMADNTRISGATFYGGDQIVGLLNQFHPDSTLVIGGANALDVHDTSNPGNLYQGNITVGASTQLADQISLGNMTLAFMTGGSGRVFNNYHWNHDVPASWSTFGAEPYDASASVFCPFTDACLTRMTTGEIYVKDSYKQSSSGPTRYVLLQGIGTGVGGTMPTGDSGGHGGSGGSGGGGSGGGGGGGSSSGGGGNDSGPGGVNEPSNDPSGGGNTGNPTPGDGTTEVVNNPGTGNGNPGGNPGSPADPATPGETGPGTPPDGGSPGGGDILAGGGEFSDGSGGTGGTGGSGSTPGGGTTPGSGNPGDPSGGGSYSDGSDSGGGGTGGVGGSGGTQVSDGSDGGFGGGGTSGGTDGSGGSGGSGGGSFSDGSGSTTPGGTQLAGGSGSGSGGSESGGFTGGGSSGGSYSGSGSSTGGGSGGGTFSDGSDSGAGGSTQVADAGEQSGSGSGSGAGGFTGGGSGSSGSGSSGSDSSGGFAGGGSGSTASSTGGSGGGSGGATFSDGSDSTPSGSTMLAGGDQGESAAGGTDSDAGFSGGGSGTAAGTSGDGSGSTETQVASDGQSVDGEGENTFSGGAGGGGSSDAQQLASAEPAQELPECGDEAQTVKQVSRAGQPHGDMLQMKATGVRLRADSGTLNQQRASCARANTTRN